MANVQTTYEVHPNGVAFKFRQKSLLGAGRVLPLREWSAAASGRELSTIGRLLALGEEDDVVSSEDTILLPHSRVAGLDVSSAASLGLPAALPLVLDVRGDGAFTDSTFLFRTRWLDQNHQVVPGTRRVGAILEHGSKSYRIPGPIFSLLEAIETYNAQGPHDTGQRLKAWAQIQSFFRIEGRDDVRAEPHILQTRVAHAAAFSLHLKTEDGTFDFDPILFGRDVRQESTLTGTTDDEESDATQISEAAQILPPAQQEVFAKARFLQGEKCRDRYALDDDWYVVLDEPVRKALDVVRKLKTADPATRRQFAKNPRAFLRDAFGDSASDEMLDAIFVETAEYSDRVLNIGIWEKPVVPWVQREGDKWLPEKFGIKVGDSPIFLEPPEVPELRKKVAEALANGAPQVDWKGEPVPATLQTIEALNALLEEIRPEESSANEGPPSGLEEDSPTEPGPIVLLIDDHFEQIGIKQTVIPRPGAPTITTPACLRTPLKKHQIEGLRWLQGAWKAGQRGVLLADDMGLGKTLQALTFLAWLREGMVARSIPAAPVLVVAPTGLLKNWEQEHEIHLHSPGLRACVRAYGNSLRDLRLSSQKETDIGQSNLRADELRAADWMLTTYETLRDYQHSFASIRFAVIVFDEIQKIKTPDTVMTMAAKAMNGDFKIGMTGTPIENRLADLWCIADALEPGILGDLKSFSRTYEAVTDSEKLTALKQRLTQRSDGLAPFMLRRMKSSVLEGLPRLTAHVLSRQMPSVQRSAYSEAILRAQRKQGPSKMLEALHALKSISLHPTHPEQAIFPEYVRQSARTDILFEVLDQIRQRQEKALIFVEALELHPVLASFIQRRYHMDKLPLVISGEVTGPKRQQRVNEFQQSRSGFDVMILSPRAGGVGLTLTAANHVIHLSRWWNPAVEDQCTDRIYRIGQEREVHVYCLQATHPDFSGSSFDERLHALLERKRTLSRDMLMPPVDVGHDIETLFTETVEGAANARAAEKDKIGSNWAAAASLDDIDAMSPLDFETWCLHRLRDHGFKVSRTPKSWDCGADGIGENPATGDVIIIQCKHIQTDGLCDEAAVSDLIRARRAYKRENAHLYAITNAPGYSETARKAASNQGVTLIDRRTLKTWPSLQN